MTANARKLHPVLYFKAFTSNSIQFTVLKNPLSKKFVALKNRIVEN